MTIAHDRARVLLREWRQQNAPRIRNREAEGLLLRQRDDERDRLGLDPARDEGEHVGGFVIEPSDLVDGAQERHLLRRLAQQTQHADRDEETVLDLVFG